MASELAKEGYFGDEYRLYGFLFWIDNKRNFITAEKVEECARIYVDSIEQGALVTPYVSYGERVYKPEKIEETMIALNKKLYDSLNEKYGKELEEKISELKQMTINSGADKILRDYYSSFDVSARGEKVQALRWLAGYSKKSGLISREDYDYLLGLLPKIEIGSGEYFKEISGFAWRVADGWEYYINAFLPTVVEKSIYLQKDGYLTSGIMSKKYYLSGKPIYELKADFQRYLSMVLDDKYLSMVCDLTKLFLNESNMFSPR